MGRSCDCCGGGACENNYLEGGFSIDRYDATYYSITETNIEEYVKFFAIDENGDIVGEPLIDKKDESKEVVIGSLSHVKNLNYVENDILTTVSASSDPELQNYLDVTHGGRFKKRSFKNVSIQTRVVLSYDLSDVLDTSEDLIVGTILRLGELSSFGLGRDSKRYGIFRRTFLRNEQEIPRGATLGVTFNTDKSKEPTFSGVTVYWFSNDYNPDLPTDFNHFDSIIDSANGIQINRISKADFGDPLNDFKAIDVSDSGPTNKKNVLVFIEPWDKRRLESQIVDEKEEVLGYYADLTENFLEIYRPPYEYFGSFSRYNYVLAKENPKEYLKITYNRRNEDDHWRDKWARVKNMWTFVSKGSFMERALNVLDFLPYYDPQDEPETRPLFSIKIYKPSTGEKKSQREEVYFDGLYHLETVKEKYGPEPPQYNGDLLCTELEEFSTVFTNEDGEEIKTPIYESKIKKDLTDRAYKLDTDFKVGLYKKEMRPDNSYGSLSSPDFYGSPHITLNCFDSVSGSRTTAYGNRPNPNNYNIFDNYFDDTIGITPDYIQNFTTTNFPRYSEFIFDYNGNPFIGYVSDVERLLQRRTDDRRPDGPFEYGIPYGSSYYDLFKNLSAIDTPDVIDIHRRTFLPNKSQKAIAEISFLENGRKFPADTVAYRGIGRCSYCSLYGFDIFDKKWKVLEQDFVFPLLPTKLRDFGKTEIENTSTECGVTIKSEDSRYEIHSEHSRVVSKTYRKYVPSHEIAYDSWDHIIDKDCDCPSNSTSPYTRPPYLGEENHIQSGRGAIKYTSWIDRCKAADESNTYLYKLSGAFGMDYYRGIYGDDLTFEKFRRQDPECFHNVHSLCDAIKHKRTSKKPSLVRKDAGWEKVIRITDPYRAIVRNLSGDGLANLYEVASGQIKEITLSSGFSSRDFGTLPIGAGISFKINGKLQFDSYDSISSESIFGQLELGKNLIPVYQRFVPSYWGQLTDEDINQIHYFTMGKFDYWYSITGKVFIEDKNGPDEKDGKGGYYVTDPSFKINTKGALEGPFDSSGFEEPPEEVDIYVKTTIQVPKLTNIQTIDSRLDMDYNPDDDFFKNRVLGSDFTSSFGEVVYVKNDDDTYTVVQDGEDKTHYVSYFFGFQGGKSVTKGPGFGYGVDRAADSYRENYYLEYVHTRDCFRIDCSNTEFENYRTSPGILTEMVVDVRWTSDQLSKCGTHSNPELRCSVSFDGWTYRSCTDSEEVLSIAWEPSGEEIDGSYIGQTPEGGSLDFTVGSILFASSSPLNVGISTIDQSDLQYGLTSDITLTHRKTILKSLLYGDSLPDISFDYSDGVFFDLKEYEQSETIFGFNNILLDTYPYYAYPDLDNAVITASLDYRNIDSDSQFGDVSDKTRSEIIKSASKCTMPFPPSLPFYCDASKQWRPAFRNPPHYGAKCPPWGSDDYRCRETCHWVDKSHNIGVDNSYYEKHTSPEFIESMVSDSAPCDGDPYWIYETMQDDNVFYADSYSNAFGWKEFSVNDDFTDLIPKTEIKAGQGFNWWRQDFNPFGRNEDYTDMWKLLVYSVPCDYQQRYEFIAGLTLQDYDRVDFEELEDCEYQIGGVSPMRARVEWKVRNKYKDYTFKIGGE
jgi:hypothetical protein